MIIPVLSKGPGLHYVWPGMETGAGNFVFQNVIGDKQPDGQWTFATWYGPYDTAKDYKEYGRVKVTEGDALTTIFELDTSTGEWTDNWILEPGSKGKSNGEQSSSGGVNVAFPYEGALTDVLFEIELQERAAWDFGTVTWDNIIIETDSSDTSWCTQPRLGQAFSYTMSQPKATLSGGRSICYIASLGFNSP